MKLDRVILMGHNYSSILGLSRALGRSGYEIYVLRTGAKSQKGIVGKMLSRRPKPDAVSKYVKKFEIVSIMDEEEVIRMLTEVFAPKGNKGILIPVDDLCAEFLDAHLDLLKKQYLLPNVNNVQGSVIKLMDKSLQKELAEAAGLPVAHGWSVTVEHGKYEIPEGVQYPCFIKAQMPMASRKNYMAKCIDRNDLIGALNKVAAYSDCKILVEEFLTIRKEYCIVGFCNKEKVCIPEIIEEIVLGHGPHAGVTCFGKVRKPERMADFIDKLQIFLERLDFQGFFTADLLETDKGYYFCELNLRLGGSGTAVIGGGVDIATLYADAVLGKTDINYDRTCNEITFASERPLLSDYILGFISWNEYMDFINKADFRFIWDPEDKVPYFCYMALVGSGMIRRVFKSKM